MDKIKQFFDQFNYIDYCSIVIYIISTVVIGYFMGHNFYSVAIITAVLVPFMFLLTLMFKSSFQYVNYIISYIIWLFFLVKLDMGKNLNMLS